jgi:hypothetical protein
VTQDSKPIDARGYFLIQEWNARGKLLPGFVRVQGPSFKKNKGKLRKKRMPIAIFTTEERANIYRYRRYFGLRAEHTMKLFFSKGIKPAKKKYMVDPVYDTTTRSHFLDCTPEADGYHCSCYPSPRAMLNQKIDHEEVLKIHNFKPMSPEQASERIKKLAADLGVTAPVAPPPAPKTTAAERLGLTGKSK